MTTVLKLGPANHGQPITMEECRAAEYASGYHYELIKGRLYVSPKANLPAGRVENWIYLRLQFYRMGHSEVVNYVSFNARVFVPGEEGETTPEPDAAAYQNYPLDLPIPEVRWEDVSPILVAEVLSADDPDKDLVRNVRLYRLVPSIREYWIIDPRTDPVHPSMIVYRRQGNRWRRFDFPAGSTYTTRLLPGFELVLHTCD